MDDEKKLFVNSALYTISGVFSKCVSFLLLPIYTIFLSPEDYGIKDLILGFNSMVTYLMLLSLDSALMRFHVDCKDDKKKLQALFSTVFWFVSAFSIAITVLCLIFNSYVTSWLLEGISFFPYVVLGLVILVFNVLQTLHRRFLEATLQGVKQTVISIIGVVGTAFFTLLFISFFSVGVTGALGAMALVNLGYVVYMIIDLGKNAILRLTFDVKLLAKCLKYSLPLVPHNMSNYIATFFSRVLLNISTGLSSVGLYSVAVQFASVIDTFQDSVGHAYRPWLNNILKNENQVNYRKRIKAVSSLLVTGYGFIFILFALFSEELILVMIANSYHEAWKLIPPLVIAYSINVIYYFYIYQCMYFHDTNKMIFVVSILGSLLSVIISYLVVPFWGAYGNIAAIAVSITIRSLMLMIIATRKEQVGYSLGKMMKTLMFVWLFIIVGIAPSYAFSSIEGFKWYLIPYKFMIVVIYCTVVYFANRHTLYTVLHCSNFLEVCAWVKRHVSRRNHT